MKKIFYLIITLFAVHTANAQKVYKQKGYSNITEANLGFGVGQYNREFSYGIQTINGYQFSPHVSLGLGAGYDKYKLVDYLSVFGDVHITLLQGPVSPFISAAYGYGIQLDGGGGTYINPAIGLKVFTSSYSAISLSIGYRGQTYTPYDTKETVSLLNIKAGLIF